MSSILIYCLGVRGTGHFMRMSLLARHLSGQHDVCLVDSGRPIIHQIPVPGVHVIELARIWQTDDGEMKPYRSSASMAEVVAVRSRQLQSACREIRPDVIIVEHFPFNKWFLRDEVLPMIQLARQLNPATKVVGSVRGLLPIREAGVTAESRRDRVLETMHSCFDCLLIHSDPQFIRLEDELPWIAQLRIPVLYTGIICQQQSESGRLPAAERSGILVSAGGDGGEQLRRCSMEAWKLLRQTSNLDLGRLTLVLPPEPDEYEIRELQQAAGDQPIAIERFSPQFLNWMQHTRLSISQAGYNTCSDVLQTRTRSILIPHPFAAEQPPRAHRFAEFGLATVLPHRELTGQTLAEAIRHALSRPAPDHHIDLGGVERSGQIIGQLLAK